MPREPAVRQRWRCPRCERVIATYVVVKEVLCSTKHPAKPCKLMDEAPEVSRSPGAASPIAPEPSVRVIKRRER